MDDLDLKSYIDPEIYSKLYGRQEELEKRVVVENEQLLLDLQEVFMTDAGRNVLQFILEICRIDSTTFTGNSMTYYLAGIQEVGKTLKRKIMEVDPELVFLIERRIWDSEQQTRAIAAGKKEESKK